MSTPQIKEPEPLDPIDEYDPEYIRQLLKERENETPVDLPPKGELLEWLKNKKYLDES